MKALGPVILIILSLLIFSTVYYYGRFKHYQRRVQFSENPLLHMDRKQRKAHIAELLERQQEAYELSQQAQLQEVIFPERKKVFHPTHNEGTTR